VFDLLHLFVQSFVWIVSVVRLFGLIWFEFISTCFLGFVSFFFLELFWNE
jgi:hypothetical protein